MLSGKSALPVVLELDDCKLPSDLNRVVGEDLGPVLAGVLDVDLDRRWRPVKVELNINPFKS